MDVCFFLQGVACGYKKDRIHSGLLVFAKSRMIFQTITLVQKWPLNSKKECSELCIADGLSYDHERRWILDLQIPSVSLDFKKMRVQIVETKPTDFQLLWSHIRNKRWWSSLKKCCCEFHSRPFAALPQTIKPQISGVSCRMQKRLLFLHAHWCCFFCSTSCYKSLRGEASNPVDMHINQQDGFELWNAIMCAGV